MREIVKRKRSAIGGDFEFDVEDFNAIDKENMLLRGRKGSWTASGRSALFLILEQLRGNGIRKILVPSFLCDRILLPIQNLGFQYSFYPVDRSLVAHPEPKTGDAVLLIHYFGWINPSTEELRAYSRMNCPLIEDASQAMLSNREDAGEGENCYVVFSPRKFGPLPFGGWCNITAEVEEPAPEMETLAWRSLAARSLRRSYMMRPSHPVRQEVEDFYLSVFRSIETYLDDHPVDAGVPQIVRDLAARLDWGRIGKIRRENWRHLDELLKNHVEPLMPTLPSSVVPLGYVIHLRDRDKVRARLADKRIFCPVHWPLPDVITARRFPDSVKLSTTCLTLPIDQRYGPEDMEHVAKTLIEAL